MIIAQISDMHVTAEGRLAYRRVDTAGHLARAVDHLLGLSPRPDAVLATGDLVDAGSPDEYARLRRLLAPLPMPVYLVPGNHDDRQALAAAFADHRYLPREGFMHYVVEPYPVRLVVLDTVVPGEGGGLMCEARLQWLDARLREAPARPTMVVMHHPPFKTGIAFMDSLGLANADALAAVIERHPQVERIVCGHLHRPSSGDGGAPSCSPRPAPPTRSRSTCIRARRRASSWSRPPVCCTSGRTRWAL
jgi:Icc protein